MTEKLFFLVNGGKKVLYALSLKRFFKISIEPFFSRNLITLFVSCSTVNRAQKFGSNGGQNLPKLSGNPMLDQRKKKHKSGYLKK